jgi:SAM-dependent methyltransferase
MRSDIYSQKAWVDKFISRKPVDEADAERTDKIIDMIPSDVTTVLDIGIGGGYIYRRLKDRGGLRCFGIDISLDLIKMAEDGSLCVSDAGSLPFKNGEFDLVVAADVLEHIKEEFFRDAASEMIRVSKKYILINSPYKDAIDWPVSLCGVCRKEFNIYGHVRMVDMALIKRIFPGDKFRMLKTEIFGKKRDARPAFLVRIARRHGRIYSAEGAVCPDCSSSVISQPPRNAVQSIFGKAVCGIFF